MALYVPPHTQTEPGFRICELPPRALVFIWNPILLLKCFTEFWFSCLYIRILLTVFAEQLYVKWSSRKLTYISILYWNAWISTIFKSLKLRIYRCNVTRQIYGAPTERIIQGSASVINPNRHGLSNSTYDMRGWIQPPP